MLTSFPFSQNALLTLADVADVCVLMIVLKSISSLEQKLFPMNKLFVLTLDLTVYSKADKAFLSSSYPLLRNK